MRHLYLSVLATVFAFASLVPSRSSAEVELLSETFEEREPGPLNVESDTIIPYISEQAGAATIQEENAYEGLRALRLLRTAELGTVIQFRPKPVQGIPGGGLSYRVSFNLLRTASHVGASARIAFGGSGHYPAGVRVSPLNQRFQYWNGESSSWTESKAQAPVGEWMAVTLTLNRSSGDPARGTYDVTVQTAAGMEAVIACDVSMSDLPLDLPRLWIGNDRPPAGVSEIETFWDNIRITLMEP